MALTDEEQKLYDAFLKLDLLDPDYGYPFIDYCENVLTHNYESRKPVLELCDKVKNRYMKLVNDGLKNPTDDIIKTVQDADPIFWGILKMEARNRQFDSYCIYLEKEREPKERFYMPRRACLRRLGIPQAFQRLIDDELDLLTISLPPGTGKASRLTSKVLTPTGFKLMKDIHVGDEVIAGNGNKATVIGVYPQGVKPCYKLTLVDGRSTEISGDHLWQVGIIENYEEEERLAVEIQTTDYIREHLRLWNHYIPVFDVERWEMGEYVDIDSIDYIGEEECQCIMIDDPCHLYITDDYIITHNTTLEKFFHSAVVGWFPMDFSLFYSHSGDITRMYYDGMVDIISNSDEYTWNEIFPELHIEGQNAKLEQLNVGKYKPFPSVQCTSVGAKNAGKVRASRFLFVDDMIGSIEEALNKNTLEKLWNAYSVDARQRKVQSPYDGIFCKELHLATRWSTLDVIGRLQTNYEDSDRAEFIAIPDIDERTGKSNFEYAIGGYTAENFHDIEILMDDISYRCLYKQDPIEREGLLYQDDELRRYIDLPNREPDAIMGICDTKEKGIDYMFLPIFYNYDNDYYLVDCICDDNSDFGLQYKRLTDIIVRHNVQQVEFESNQGGSRIAFEIQKRLKERGCRCNITTKPTETNKETRIIVNSDWIKQNCLFLNKTEYSPKSDYGKMMSFMVGYSVTGKNKHDDVPDGLANFALFVNRKLHYKPAQYTPGLF